MSLERSRRDRFANKAPLTGEVGLLVALLGLCFVLVIPLLVQGLVGLVKLGEFVWPSGHLPAAYAGLVRGRFGAGLGNGAAAALPTAALMWLFTLVGEVVGIAAAIVVGVWVRDLTGHNTRHGLATVTSAAAALGLPRLYKSAPVIRPDLYARPDKPKTLGRKVWRR